MRPARENWIMKHISSGIAALALFFCSAGPLFAQTPPGRIFPDEPLPKNCTWCHGVNSAQGFSTAPRLAGQRTSYIEKEIGAFHEHIRDNPNSRKYMWNAVGDLGPSAARDLAAYFSAQPPRAAEDGNRDLVAAGRQIYQEGIAETNIVTCTVCHGPNAEGIRDIPRLGGLSYYYLKRRLEQWNEGYHAAAAPMPQVARALSANEIEALASYLSFIE